MLFRSFSSRSEGLHEKGGPRPRKLRACSAKNLLRMWPALLALLPDGGRSAHKVAATAGDACWERLISLLERLACIGAIVPAAKEIHTSRSLPPSPTKKHPTCAVGVGRLNAGSAPCILAKLFGRALCVRSFAKIQGALPEVGTSAKSYSKSAIWDLSWSMVAVSSAAWVRFFSMTSGAALATKPWLPKEIGRAHV